MKFYFTIAVIILTCNFIFAQDEVTSVSSEVYKSWIIKAQYFQNSYISSTGLGIEKQLGKHLSFVVSFNAIRYIPEGKKQPWDQLYRLNQS